MAERQGLTRGRWGTGSLGSVIHSIHVGLTYVIGLLRFREPGEHQPQFDTHAPLTRNLFCNEREEANEEANRLVPDRHWCLSQRGGQGGKKGLIPSKPVSG